MGKGKRKPRKAKQAGRALEVLIDFFLGVIGSIVADLITAAVRKLFS